MNELGDGTFRSLAGFNYRLWALGALVSNVGTWMQRTAQVSAPPNPSRRPRTAPCSSAPSRTCAGASWPSSRRSSSAPRLVGAPVIGLVADFHGPRWALGASALARLLAALLGLWQLQRDGTTSVAARGSAWRSFLGGRGCRARRPTLRKKNTSR